MMQALFLHAYLLIVFFLLLEIGFLSHSRIPYPEAAPAPLGAVLFRHFAPSDAPVANNRLLLRSCPLRAAATRAS